MTDREKFEGWLSGQNPHGYTGGYPWWRDAGLWKAWQAALSAAPTLCQDCSTDHIVDVNKKVATPQEVEPVGYGAQIYGSQKWAYVWHESDDVQNWINLHHQSRDDVTYAGPIPLYTHPAPNDEWREAVLNECMAIEGCYKESDPVGTLKCLLDWHAYVGVIGEKPNDELRAAAEAMVKGFGKLTMNQAMILREEYTGLRSALSKKEGE